MDEIPLIRLGQSLRDARTRRGLTQAQAARLAGLGREKVVHIEQGRATIAISSYVALAGALGAELALVPMRRPTIEEVERMLADA